MDMFIMPHSIRAAFTTTAVNAAVPLTTILKTAGWPSKVTFAKLYHTTVERPTMANPILERAQSSQQD